MEEKTLHVRKTDNVKEKYCILIILISYQSKNVTFGIYIYYEKVIRKIYDYVIIKV